MLAAPTADRLGYSADDPRPSIASPSPARPAGAVAAAFSCLLVPSSRLKRNHALCFLKRVSSICILEKQFGSKRHAADGFRLLVRMNGQLLPVSHDFMTLYITQRDVCKLLASGKVDGWVFLETRLGLLLSFPGITATPVGVFQTEESSVVPAQSPPLGAGSHPDKLGSDTQLTTREVGAFPQGLVPLGAGWGLEVSTERQAGCWVRVGTRSLSLCPDE